MSDPSSNSDLRPDLDESINVSGAHGALKDGTAAGREKTVRENGMEAVSLWLVLISAIVVLAAGAVMGQGGSFFGYGELTKDGYIRAESPVEIPVEPQPIAILDLLKKEGKKLYNNCASCHQSTGVGGGDFPPLVGSEWVLGNTQALAMIVHNGAEGPFEVKGTVYNKAAMPAIGSLNGYGPKELAAVLTYIRNEWGNEASVVTPEMAAVALKISKERGGAPTTAEELKKSHDKMLPGDTLDPTTLVDPITWEPVATEE